MDPKENLDKTIEEVTAEAEAQKDEAVAEEVKVEEVAEPVAEAKEPVVPEPVASEPVASEPEKDDIVFSDKPQKKGKGLVLGMILFALLAAGGVGFGVWAMMDKNAEVGKLNTQIADLKKQITQLKKQIPVDYEDEEGTEDEEPADVEVEDVNTEDYIYVGEWGLKIKIPDSLSMVGYNFGNGTYGEWLSVAGLKNGVTGEAVYKYTYVEDYIAGQIVRSNSDDGFYPYGALVYTDDEQNNYYFTGPQADMGSTEEETAIWKESAEIVKEMLTNPDNYSKI